MATLPQARAVHTLPGMMMDVPLTIESILAHAVRNHARREIVSRDGSRIVRLDYAGLGGRVAQLAHALGALGVRGGERVASFGWNTHRHLELYYAVPCIGAVLHTANIRLFPAQVAELLRHAGDRVVFVDGSLVPAMQRAIAALPELAACTFVIMGEAAETLPNSYDYETLLARQPDQYRYPDVPETAAAVLCYTSATTGEPKGVLFSHRSQCLHAFATGLHDAFALSQRDVVLPIVPQFHVNAWGIPYLAPLVGAKLVMPGAALDPQSVCDLVEREGVTMSAGVPTVWLAARDYLRATGRRLTTLTRVVIGGSAVPASLFDELEALGITVVHAWGMTEMSPVGTISAVTADLAQRPPAEQRAKRLKQGLFSPIVRWRVVDADGANVPQDGVTRGELHVRGPAVAAAYFDQPAASEAAFVDGWFKTGDIVTVDADGYMEIVDRVRDMIKSGGEWISSVELENLLMGHPAVQEACVFGVPHERWIERPIAAVVLRAGEPLDEAALRAWLAARVATWWLPDRILFLAEIPRSGVGKFLKRELRERYRSLLTA